MAGVLQGIRVLDLSWGIAGPMAAMLMADHGADVTKIEPPGGDPFRDQLGYKVWQRGKRSAVLDLKNEADKQAFLALVQAADVLVESYTPGVTERLGIDYATLARLNPRLVYCSITGYGRGTEDEGRPAYDALVAARTGLHWEQRGWPEGALNHLAGRDDPFPDLDIPYDWLQGAARPGPLFPSSHWPSLGAFFSASANSTRLAPPNSVSYCLKILTYGWPSGNCLSKPESTLSCRASKIMNSVTMASTASVRPRLPNTIGSVTRTNSFENLPCASECIGRSHGDE